MRDDSMQVLFDKCASLSRLLRQMETCGKPFVAAINGTAMGGGTSIDPHRQRVCAVLQSVEARIDEPERWNPLARAVALAYDLERLRCPLGPGFDLGSADLLAWAARIAEKQHDPRWVRALFAAHGVLPPNTRVQLADGRLGVALGGAEDEAPFLPLVYLKGEGVVALPEEPVQFARSNAPTET
jgi:hypothetical protein